MVLWLIIVVFLIYMVGHYCYPSLIKASSYLIFILLPVVVVLLLLLVALLVLLLESSLVIPLLIAFITRFLSGCTNPCALAEHR